MLPLHSRLAAFRWMLFTLFACCLSTCLTASAWANGAGTQVTVVRASARTTAGEQVFQRLGMSTPKLAVFFINSGTLDGVPEDGATQSIGMVSGPGQMGCAATMMHHGATETSAWRQGDASVVLSILDPSSGDPDVSSSNPAVERTASFVEFVAATDPAGGGIRILWDQGGPPRQVTCVLFGGDDFQAQVGNFVNDNGINAATVISGLPFAPEVIWGASHRGDFNDGTIVSTGAMSFGIAAHVNSSIKQYSVNWYSRNSTHEGTDTQALFDDRILTSMTNSQLRQSLEVTSFENDGFVVRNRNMNGEQVLFYAAMSFGGNTFDIVEMTTPTTGSAASPTEIDVNVGLETQLGLILLSRGPLGQFHRDDGAHGLGFFTSQEEVSHSLADEDGAGIPNTQGLVDSSAIQFPRQDGSSGLEAHRAGIDSDSVQLSFTSVDSGTSRTLPMFVLSEPPGNQPPLAFPEEYAFGVLNPLTVPAASGVLENDLDLDSTTITAELVQDVSSGSLTLFADGGFEFVPTQATATEFSYRAFDGESWSDEVFVQLLPVPGQDFIRGDCGGDGFIDISDPIQLLGIIFNGYAAGTCLDACDANDDNNIDLADVVAMLNIALPPGIQPPAPFPNCGWDPSPSSYGCAGHGACP